MSKIEYVRSWRRWTLGECPCLNFMIEGPNKIIAGDKSADFSQTSAIFKDFFDSYALKF